MLESQALGKRVNDVAIGASLIYLMDKAPVQGQRSQKIILLMPNFVKRPTPTKYQCKKCLE